MEKVEYSAIAIKKSQIENAEFSYSYKKSKIENAEYSAIAIKKS